MKRRPIIFMHIPKCGGQSVNAMLDDAIRRSSLNYQDVVTAIWDGQEKALVFCEAALRADFISGHITLDMVDYIRARTDAYVFTVLRDPAERLASELRYLAENSVHGFEGLAGLPLEDLLCALREQLRANNVRWYAAAANVTTRMLSGSISPLFMLGAGHPSNFTERAKTNLKTFDAVGTIDALPALLEAVRLGAGIDADINAVHLNKTSRSSFSQDAQLVREVALDCVDMDDDVYSFARQAQPAHHTEPAQ